MNPARLAIVFLLILGANAVNADDAPRPHIVILLADDLGWNDVGYHRSSIKTPNIDRLAAGGTRLKRFYVQPLCSPTRAALMTGRYPMRYGMHGIVVGEAGLPTNERTLADALRSVGYRTVICGKWHLGYTSSKFTPKQRGFDEQYGCYVGSIDYFTHEHRGGLDWRRDGKPLREEGYVTNLLAAQAERVIAEHDPDQPLFLYVPFTAPHQPLQAPQRYLDLYAHVTNHKRRTYSAMVACLDDADGRIVRAIKQRGMRDNTLIVFFSDNGGNITASGASNEPLRNGKGYAHEGGIRVPACMNWPGVLRRGSSVAATLHVMDLYPTLLMLAGASLDQPLPIDGKDIWPTIVERKPSPHEELLLHLKSDGTGALLQDVWKLVVLRGPHTRSTELFNIAHDPTESKNLSAEYPGRVEAMRRRLAQYRAQAADSLALAGEKPERDKLHSPKIWGPPD